MTSRPSQFLNVPSQNQWRLPRTIWRSSKSLKPERSTERACLAPKAEAELARMEANPAPQNEATTTTVTDPDSQQEQQQQQVDPEKVKEGYRKAGRTCAKGGRTNGGAVKSLKAEGSTGCRPTGRRGTKNLGRDPAIAAKNDQKQNQQNKDQQNNEGQNQNQDKQNNEDQKQDEQKKEDQDNKGESQGDQKTGPEESATSFKDRIEEALRKVREREQDKRERDKKMRAQFRGKVRLTRIGNEKRKLTTETRRHREKRSANRIFV